MKENYIIEEVKFGLSDEHYMCCNYIQNEVAAVKFRVGDEHCWMYNVMFEGMNNFYFSEEDIFDKLIHENLENEEEAELLANKNITDYEGEELPESKEEDNNIENQGTRAIVRLLLYVSAHFEDNNLKEDLKQFENKNSDEVNNILNSKGEVMGLCANKLS